MVHLFYNNQNEYTKLIEDSNLDDSFLCIIGGDGTFLKALASFEFNQIPRILAFNNGTIGFLLPLKLSNISEILKNAKQNKLKMITRSRMFIKSHNKLIVNEIVIKSKHFRLNRFEIHIDDFRFHINACEVVISTKTGSTGYNSSLNGPIMFSDGFLLNCSAPNRCNFKTLVFSENSKIEIYTQDCVGYFDGIEYEGDFYEITRGDSYELCVDEDYSEFKAINSIFYNMF